MKKFLEIILPIKLNACIIFAGSIILYTVVCLLLGTNSMDLMIIISFAVLSFFGAGLQYFAFSGNAVKNIGYSWRIIIFVVPFAVLLTACAVIFNWFPLTEVTAWLIFVGIFLLAFIGITASFEVYYKVTGKKYDGLLGQYKSKNKTENN